MLLLFLLFMMPALLVMTGEAWPEAAQSETIAIVIAIVIIIIVIVMDLYLDHVVIVVIDILVVS